MGTTTTTTRANFTNGQIPYDCVEGFLHLPEKSAFHRSADTLKLYRT